MTVNCRHEVLKGSKALVGQTYITKTLFPPTKLCIFQWTSQCNSLKFSFSSLKESRLRDMHTVGLFNFPFVKRFRLKLLHFLQIWYIKIWLECKRFMLLKTWNWKINKRGDWNKSVMGGKNSKINKWGGTLIRDPRVINT